MLERGLRTRWRRSGPSSRRCRVSPGPAATPGRAGRRVEQRSERKAVDLSWLEGPTGLAVAGGAVTLLGVVFVFALAASRGWIGPAVRCSIGGGVSVALVGASLIVRRRFGHMVAALAASGAGSAVAT